MIVSIFVCIATPFILFTYVGQNQLHNTYLNKSRRETTTTNSSPAGSTSTIVDFPTITATTSSNEFLYYRFCIRNFGCDTDFRDMVQGVSLFLNYQVLHESDYSIRDHA